MPRPLGGNLLRTEILTSSILARGSILAATTGVAEGLVNLLEEIIPPWRLQTVVLERGVAKASQVVS